MAWEATLQMAAGGARWGHGRATNAGLAWSKGLQPLRRAGADTRGGQRTDTQATHHERAAVEGTSTDTAQHGNACGR